MQIAGKTGYSITIIHCTCLLNIGAAISDKYQILWLQIVIRQRILDNSSDNQVIDSFIIDLTAS